MPDPSNLPVPTPTWDNARLAKLANELAKNIREIPEVLKSYGITEAQFEVIEKTEFFKRAFENSVIEWQSAENAQARIKIEAAVALEDALPAIAARMTKEGEALSGVVETGKLFAKLAQIGEGRSEGLPGEKFSITINLGEDKKLTFEKDITPTSPLIEEKAHEPA